MAEIQTFPTCTYYCVGSVMKRVSDISLLMKMQIVLGRVTHIC